MADSKITALTALTAADPANDMIPIVDVSDTPPASGNTKRISINNILAASGTATLASATITGDLTVATDRLKVVTGSTAVQIGSTTQTQIGTTAWPTDLISKANSRVLIGNLGTTLLWNESAPAIGNASTLYIGAKTGAGATTFGGGYISAGTENASDRAGFFALSTFQSNGIDRERYRIDSTGVHTWQYVGGVAGTAMTLNATGLGVGKTPLARLDVASARAASVIGGIVGTTGTGVVADECQFLIKNVNTASGQNNGAGIGGLLEASASNKSSLLFYVDNGTAVTNVGRFDSNGNLLVGTTSGLQLSNNVAVTSRIANLGTGSKGAMILRENEASAFWGGNLYLQKVRGTSTAVQSGDSLGLVAFGGFDGTNYVNTGTIQTLVTGAVSAGVVPVKIQVVATSGGVELTNTATSWAAISDERLKDIIEPINNAVAKVGLLRSVIGKYKSDSEGTRRSFLIAQDVQSALPEAVGGNEDSMTVRYTEVIPLLVAAIKELTARVQTLEAK